MQFIKNQTKLPDQTKALKEWGGKYRPIPDLDEYIETNTSTHYVGDRDSRPK